MKTLASLFAIKPNALSVIDLRAEATPPGELTPDDANPCVSAYRGTVAREDGTIEGQPLEVLYLHEADRIGIAWGGDAIWADMLQGERVERLVEMYLTDAQAFAARA